MPLFLNDEQTMLRDTAKDFVAEHAPVAHLRALRDANDATGFSRDLWKQFAEMGFTGILIGEDQGGLGLGHVEAGVVLEEIGRNLSPSPFLATAVAAVEALKGTPHAERWFPGIVAGETVAALAIERGWAAVVVDGLVRDSDELAGMPIGVWARGTTPRRGRPEGPGVHGIDLPVGGSWVRPGARLAADGDGIVVVE